MREIKFRAWDKVKKTFPFIGFNIIGEVTAFDMLNQYQLINFIDLEIQQFTGLKDKHGNEIYCGDIIKAINDNPMVVGWSDKYASFVLDREGWAFSHWFGESCNSEDVEIIGNIHSNPELLK